MTLTKLSDIGTISTGLMRQGYIISKTLNSTEYDFIIEDGDKLQRILVVSLFSRKNYDPWEFDLDLRGSLFHEEEGKIPQNYDLLYVTAPDANYLIPKSIIQGKQRIRLNQKYDQYRLLRLNHKEEYNFLMEFFENLTGQIWHMDMQISEKSKDRIKLTHNRLKEITNEMKEFYCFDNLFQGKGKTIMTDQQLYEVYVIRDNENNVKFGQGKQDERKIESLKEERIIQNNSSLTSHTIVADLSEDESKLIESILINHFGIDTENGGLVGNKQYEMTNKIVQYRLYLNRSQYPTAINYYNGFPANFNKE